MSISLCSGPRSRFRWMGLCAALWMGIAGLGQAQEVVYLSDYDQSWEGESCLDCLPSCEACCEPACGPSCGAGYGERFWVGADYLLWQLSGSDLPPLVTASPAGTPLGEAGIIGDPSTEILVGNQEVGGDWRSGYRLYGGFWLDPCQTCAITLGYFDTGSNGFNSVQGPSSDSIITRPYWNDELGAWDVELVTLPDELNGDVTVSASDGLVGASIGLQKCLRRSCDPCTGCPQFNLDLVGGYRFLQYKSRLGIHEDLTVLPDTTSPLVPGTNILVDDRFATKNDFHGGEIGVKGRVTRGCMWVEGLASVMLGANHRSVSVSGSTVNTVPGSGTATFDGGLLTSSETNIGHYSNTKAVAIPEFRLGVGCQVSQRLSMHAGYNVILWNDVAMAVDHLPAGLQVDPRNLPPVVAGGGLEPMFPGISCSTMVAHGFDFGVEFVY